MPKLPGKGRKRTTVRGDSQGEPSNSGGKGPSHQPSHSHFTPAEPQQQPQSTLQQLPPLPHTSTSASADVQNYPQPRILFQNSPDQQSPLPTLPRSLPDAQNQTPHVPDSESPRQPPREHSQPSSQGNNYPEDADVVLPELQPDMARALNALLCVSGREKFTTVLSPIPKPNMTWYVIHHLIVRIITRCARDITT